MASPNQRGIGLWVLLLGYLWAIPCEAQTARTEHTLRLEPGADRPAASISDAAWLAGRWVGEGLGATVEEARSLVLRLKHFGPDLAGWEEKNESVDFPLVRRTPDTLWFDGLTIRREGEDRMRIWVALQPDEGEVREERFEYRRIVRSQE